MSVVDRSHGPSRRDADARRWLPTADAPAVPVDTTPRPTPTSRARPTLADGAILLPLLGLTGVLLALGLTHAPARTDAEGALVTVAAPGEVAAAAGDPAPLAALQVGWLTRLVGADPSGGLTVASTRGVGVVLALVSGLLLWALVRRVPLPRWVAAVALLLAAVVPAAVAAHRVTTPAAVAVPWLLAGLLLSRGRTSSRSRTSAAVVCLSVAALTSAACLLVLPAAWWLLWRGARRGAVRDQVVAAAAVTGTIVVATWVLAAQAARGGSLLPVGPWRVWQDVSLSGLVVPLVVVAAAVVGLFVHRLRPYAVAGLVLLVAVAVAGDATSAPTTLLVPVACLLVPGAGWTVVVYRPTRLVGRDVRRSGAYAALLVGGLLLGLAGPSVTAGLGRLVGDDEDAPAREAVAWSRGTVPPDAVVLAGSAVWPDLVHDGRDAARFVRFPGRPGVDTVPDTVSWVFATAAVRDASVPPDVAALLHRGEVVRTFGAGAHRIDVLRVPPAATDHSEDTAPAPTPSEPAPSPSGSASPTTASDGARDATAAAAGRELARNPALELSAGARADLVAGRVDLRLTTVLAALAAGYRLDVDAFPVSVDDPTGLLRAVRIASVDGASPRSGAAVTGRLERLLDRQPAAFRPDVEYTPGTEPDRSVLVLTLPAEHR